MEETVPPQQKLNGMNKGVMLALIIGILALVIVGYEATKPKNEIQKTTDSSPATTVPKKIDYKSGSYNAIGNYTSPGGAEEIDVTLTLKDDIITEAKVVSKASRPISKEKQGIFIENFKSQVIGEKIDKVKLDKVSSSSLTPKGFNDALEKIKQEAKA